MAVTDEHGSGLGPRLEQNGQARPHLSQVAGNYGEWPAVAALQAAVRCVWRNVLRPTGRPLLVVPDGCIDLIWTGSALLIAGPDTGPVVEAVSPDATIVGVRFRPGAARPWLNASAVELANRRFPLSDFWGRPAHQLEDQMSQIAAPERAAQVLERALSIRAASAAAPDPMAQNLRCALEERVRAQESQVGDLTADLGLSERTLRRQCHELFGYGAKTFLRILRFQQFIARARRADRVSLASLAGLCGYADRAHLSREVRGLCGLTPREVVTQLREPLGGSRTD